MSAQHLGAQAQSNELTHSASHQSLHNSLHSRHSSATSIIKGKGDPRLKNYNPESLKKRCCRNKLNKKIGLAHAVSKTMTEFQEKLASAATINISTKKKHATEAPLIGKSGYKVSLNDDTYFGLLLSRPSEIPCCGNSSTVERNENDPINYYLVTPAGEELITIHGLDDNDDLENLVEVTTSALKTKLGTVEYGYLGADGETVSKATTLAGRDDSYVIPTSVTDEDGVLLYIFRRDQDNTAHYTEILSADGTAMTVAEVLINYKNSKANVTTSRRGEGLATSLSLNFIEAVSPKDKMLLFGISVTLFNQWLTRQKRRKLCCVVQ